jgi:1-acyl-sn-glycerol-3-phosphate acyltransferase
MRVGDAPWRAMRVAARGITRVLLPMRVEGLEHLPAHGPYVLAARHFHHFFDGCVIIATIPRPTHFVVAVDWLSNAPIRALAEFGYSLIRWPVVIRSDGLVETSKNRDLDERFRYLRSMMDMTADLLEESRVIVMFPEGHTNVDPSETPKSGDLTAFLPFQPGFLRIADHAQRHRDLTVPIVPVGFEFDRRHRWRVTVRYGAPIVFDSRFPRDAAIRRIENDVRRLCGLPLSELHAEDRLEPHSKALSGAVASSGFLF